MFGFGYQLPIHLNIGPIKGKVKIIGKGETYILVIFKLLMDVGGVNGIKGTETVGEIWEI